MCWLCAINFHGIAKDILYFIQFHILFLQEDKICACNCCPEAKHEGNCILEYICNGN